MGAPQRAESDLVSVLLPVRDGAQWLRPAIASILGQTRRELELLVLDDGSRDESLEIAASFKDSRVVIDEHPELAGRAARLNDGIEMASGVYLARMDADDIADSRRLALQVSHFCANPEVAILGARMRTFGHGRSRLWRPPVGHDDIAAELLFHSPIAHPTVMFDAEKLRAADLRYDATLTGAEDWDLWLRARRRLRLANIDDVVLRYRVRPPGAKPADDDARIVNYREVTRRCLEELGVEHGPDDVERHFRIGHRQLLSGHAGMDEAEAWLTRLVEANDAVGAYPIDAFRRAAARWWSDACYLQAGRLGPAAGRRYRSSPLAKLGRPGPGRRVRFAVRMLESFVARTRSE